MDQKSEIWKSRPYPAAATGPGRILPNGGAAGHHPVDNEHFAQNGDPYVRRALMEAEIPGTGVDAGSAPALEASLEQECDTCPKT